MLLQHNNDRFGHAIQKTNAWPCYNNNNNNSHQMHTFANTQLQVLICCCTKVHAILFVQAVTAYVTLYDNTVVVVHNYVTPLASGGEMPLKRSAQNGRVTR